jgi:YVTN family beta-propeller protein
MARRASRPAKAWHSRARAVTSCAHVTRVAVVGLLLAGCSRGHAEARAGTLAYVSNETAGEIDVIDVERAQLVERIPVGKRPRGLKLSADGRTLFVALSGSPIGGPHVDESKLPPPDRAADGIAVLDLQARKVQRTIPSGNDPESFDLSRDGQRLYVSNEDSGELSIVDVAAGRVRRRLPVGGEPEGVAVRPDGAFVYVTSEADGQVAVVDTRSESVIARIPVGPRPRTILFTPDSKMAFVSVEQGASVAFIDAQAHRLLAQVPIPDGLGHFWPMGLALSRDGRKLHVSGGRGRAVARIDVGERQVETTLREVGQRPWGLAGSSDGHTLIAANGPSHDVSLIDVATGNVRARVTTGGSPWGVIVAEARAP